MKKKLAVFIVRFLPLLLFIIVGVVTYQNKNGISIYPFNLLHSNSAIYALAIFIVSLCDNKYHCIWNRAMYIELFIIPIINYINGKYFIIQDLILYYDFILKTYYITIGITIFLAIRHFILKRKNRYQEYKLK